MWRVGRMMMVWWRGEFERRTVIDGVGMSRSVVDVVIVMVGPKIG